MFPVISVAGAAHLCVSALMTPFELLVQRIRSEQGLGREVPGFDPQNGNEHARFLFVLEAPGPKAVARGVISLDNPDLTARNLRAQLDRAEIHPSDIALWNVVPWYLGNSDRSRIRAAKNSDVKRGLEYLVSAVSAMHELQFIVLVGGAARQAHIALSHQTHARILSCHHPSPKVQNTDPEAAGQNIAVFRHMLAAANASANPSIERIS